MVASLVGSSKRSRRSRRHADLRGRAGRIVAVSLGLGLLLHGGELSAGNQTHPRTPVLWPEGGACLQIVEREVSPVVHFDYAVPFNDTSATQDELEDSRTHQFIAFCRSWPANEAPPRYLSSADLMRALDADLQDPADLSADPVVDESPFWSTCARRITADDDRRPITETQAALGFDWDTSGFPEGAYVVSGFTWEPDLSLWSPRRGVVLVVDAFAESSPPAVALSTTEWYAEADALFPLEGCMHAPPDTELVAEYRIDGTEAWVEFSRGPAQGESFSLAFQAPPESWGGTVDLRVRLLETTGGREAEAHLQRRVIVLSGASDEETTGGGAESATTAADGGSEGDTGEESQESGKDGGGCNLGGGAKALPLITVIWLRRRRRRDANGSTRAQSELAPG